MSKRFVYSASRNAFYDTKVDPIELIPKPFVWLESSEYDRLRMMLAADSDLIVKPDDKNRPIVINKYRMRDIQEFRDHQKSLIVSSAKKDIESIKNLEFNNGNKLNMDGNFKDIILSIILKDDIRVFSKTGSIFLGNFELEEKVLDYKRKVETIHAKVDRLVAFIDYLDDKSEIECVQWEMQI